MQTVRGNTALALLLTVSSNLLGIFTMPFLLCQLLGASGSGVTIKAGPLLSNLLRTILAPLLGGALIRATIPGQPLALLSKQPMHACLETVGCLYECDRLPIGGCLHWCLMYC